MILAPEIKNYSAASTMFASLCWFRCCIVQHLFAWYTPHRALQTTSLFWIGPTWRASKCRHLVWYLRTGGRFSPSSAAGASKTSSFAWHPRGESMQNTCFPSRFRKPMTGVRLPWYVLSWRIRWWATRAGLKRPLCNPKQLPNWWCAYATAEKKILPEIPSP